ncbi:MAG TPA: hypothetical protein VEB68_13595, partial [Croceibacterium sp.]|nr:hypothetical protein [Croceibacterium sp.]
MRRLATAIAAIVLMVGAAHAPGFAQGNGKGDRGRPAAAAAQGGGQGNGRDQGARGNGGDGSSMAASMRGSDARGNGNAQRDNRGNANAQRDDRGQGNAIRDDRGGSGEARADRGNRGNGNQAERASQSADTGDGGRGNDRSVAVERRDVVVVERDDRDREFIRIGSRGLIDGCPPGLATKNPPCVPPGQARADDRRLFAFDQPDWWGLSGLDDGRYVYDDGYLMRFGPDGRIGGYVPLLGGALAIGNAWPGFYEPVMLPTYYSDYYDLGPYDSYRYADNVIYRIDPETAAITSIAALLTGDDFAIGQPLPLGYDV